MLSAALLALALFAQEPAAAPAAPAAAEPPVPTGAPADDYGLTAWCYGSVTRWRELRDRVLPEVRRIEGAFRNPERTLEEDMAQYDALFAESARDEALLIRALRAAERASPRGLEARREAATAQGRRVLGSDARSDVELARDWMGWALPARCAYAAARVLEQAELAAPALRGAEGEAGVVETQPEPAPAVN